MIAFSFIRLIAKSFFATLPTKLAGTVRIKFANKLETLIAVS